MGKPLFETLHAKYSAAATDLSVSRKKRDNMGTDQRISTTQSVQPISRGEQSGALEEFSSAKVDALGQDFHHNISIAVSTERQPQFMSLEELRAEEKWLQRAIIARIKVCTFGIWSIIQILCSRSK